MPGASSGCATLLLLAALACASCAGSLRVCEPIRVGLCRGLGYNHTGMPNLVGHELQADADFTLQTFSPLIQYGCSAQLNFFLCSVFVPMCTEKVAVPIGPCRGLCEAVRGRCFPVLQGFGFPWPAALDCAKFPAENDHEHMCMEGPGEMRSQTPGVTGVSVEGVGTTRAVGACARLARPDAHVYVNRSSRCAQLCAADVLWSTPDKTLAEAWVSTWAAAAFASTLLAGLTAILAPRGPAARYPARPLLWLALCYNLHAVGWLLRAIAGREAVACGPDPGDPRRLLLSQDGLGNAHCAAVFILLYYFGSAAAAVWWVVVTLCWFLTAALGWTHEQIQQHASLFHLAGWGLPAAQTIAVLVLRDVDADELTGACFVGGQSAQSLLVFVLAPQFFYLTLGSALLITGLCAVVRGQSPPHAGSLRRCASPMPAQDKHEASALRLGLFCAAYALPAALGCAAALYEFTARDAWLAAPAPTRYPTAPPRPKLWVFLLRLFASLVPGVTALAWVWSDRSMRAWRQLLRRLDPAAHGPGVKAAPLPPQPPPPLRCSPAQHKPRKHRKHGSETTV